MKIATFPNPAMRSASEPATLASPIFILKAYNIIHSLKAPVIDDTVKAWFKAEAKEVGWNRVEFIGEQALLVKEFK